MHGHFSIIRGARARAAPPKSTPMVITDTSITDIIPANLDEYNEVLVEHLLHQFTVQVTEDGNAQVDLIIGTKNDAKNQVLADLRPVEIVPETLAYPLLADLESNHIKAKKTF